MAAYIALARKWRPSQFSDIVGQTPIVRTLMNAIHHQRTYPGYLFTGSRGIGKTSIARIFAKAIRCENTKFDDGVLASCDQCSSCKEITATTSVDVIEIDGASNNGVDAVREIRENAKFMPASGERKVYIIDEVHMLTTAAFNALLKTLEEPPPHVIFIFATTEPHKIPSTILSRCQRFDFRRPTLTQIEQRLQEVAKQENLEVESGALALLARAADGSMRDALSLLDQAIAYAGQNLTVSSVREGIGLIESESLLAILKGLLGRDAGMALGQLDQIYQQGHDLRVLLKNLVEFLHVAVLCKVDLEGKVALQASPEELVELKNLSQLRELEEMELIFQALHQGVEWVARSSQPKAVLDMLFIKCAMAEALVVLGEEKQPTASPSAKATPSPRPRFKAAPPPVATPKPQPRPQVVAAPKPQIQPKPQQPPQPKAPPKPQGPRNLEGLVSHVRSARPLLAALVEHAIGMELQDQPNGDQAAELKLLFTPKDEHKTDQIKGKTYSDQLTRLASEFFGRPVYLLPQVVSSQGESLAVRRAKAEAQKKENTMNAIRQNPILQEAKSLFGGTYSHIELRES